jgi:hypothetical protein
MVFSGNDILQNAPKNTQEPARRAAADRLERNPRKIARA